MQQRIRCSIMRGGTSKALFFRREDLPVDIAMQDWVLLAALGNPDPTGRLVDGLGGPISSTSKVAIISKRSGEPNTVDYTFGQGSHKNRLIDREGNCGNISAAVGPFAIDEGLVEAHEPGVAMAAIDESFAKEVRDFAEPKLDSAIFTTTKAQKTGSFGGSDMNDLMRRFFGDQFPGHSNPRGFDMPRQTGVGSGVIATKVGYILTNNHVVDGASQVDVNFTDGIMRKGAVSARAESELDEGEVRPIRHHARLRQMGPHAVSRREYTWHSSKSVHRRVLGALRSGISDIPHGYTFPDCRKNKHA